MILPEWDSTDENFAVFFERLLALPEVERDFVEQVRRRELDGRDTFGYRYLDRDNAAEAQEEAADLALYAHLETLRARRERRPEQTELALEVARHAAEAHALLERMREPRRRRG